VHSEVAAACTSRFMPAKYVAEIDQATADQTIYSPLKPAPVLSALITDNMAPVRAGQWPHRQSEEWVKTKGSA